MFFLMKRLFVFFGLLSVGSLLSMEKDPMLGLSRVLNPKSGASYHTLLLKEGVYINKGRRTDPGASQMKLVLIKRDSRLSVFEGNFEKDEEREAHVADMGRVVPKQIDDGRASRNSRSKKKGKGKQKRGGITVEGVNGLGRERAPWLRAVQNGTPVDSCGAVVKAANQAPKQKEVRVSGRGPQSKWVRGGSRANSGLQELWKKEREEGKRRYDERNAERDAAVKYKQLCWWIQGDIFDPMLGNVVQKVEEKRVRLKELILSLGSSREQLRASRALFELVQGRIDKKKDKWIAEKIENGTKIREARAVARKMRSEDEEVVLVGDFDELAAQWAKKKNQKRKKRERQRLNRTLSEQSLLEEPVEPEKDGEGRALLRKKLLEMRSRRTGSTKPRSCVTKFGMTCCDGKLQVYDHVGQEYNLNFDGPALKLSGFGRFFELVLVKGEVVVAERNYLDTIHFTSNALEALRAYSLPKAFISAASKQLLPLEPQEPAETNVAPELPATSAVSLAELVSTAEKEKGGFGLLAGAIESNFAAGLLEPCNFRVEGKSIDLTRVFQFGWDADEKALFLTDSTGNRLEESSGSHYEYDGKLYKVCSTCFDLEDADKRGYVIRDEKTGAVHLIDVPFILAQASLSPESASLLHGTLELCLMHSQSKVNA